MSATVIGFVVYLIVIFVVGLLTFKHNKTISDYVLGGRRLGIWVITFSERASGESSWLLLGLPAALYANGLLDIWVAVGCCTGILVSWMVIAKPLRLQSEQVGAITLPQFFSNTFNDTTHAIRYLATVIIVVFFTFYVSAQFIGAGKVLNVTFGIDKFDGMLLGAGIIQPTSHRSPFSNSATRVEHRETLFFRWQKQRLSAIPFRQDQGRNNRRASSHSHKSQYQTLL
ncbi:hypothetical protein JYU19_01735 [bacterium AH-315-J21]|nr:hypothetical protein [bacterium AH-315-J21]